MKKDFSLYFQNVTLRQAHIAIIIITFIFTMIFVFLLIDDIYKDYENVLETNLYITKTDTTSDVYIDEKKQKLKSILIKTILAIITLSFIIFAIALGFYKIFSDLLQRDTQNFLDFFAIASKKDVELNPNTIFFQDFKLMAGYANKMVDKISKQKYELQELNNNLEQRVKDKTKKLQIANEDLEFQKQQKDIILANQKQFLRYTVHETNTPLSIILASIELYVLKHPKDRQLQKIEAAVKNIFNIYDDLSYLVKKDQVQYPKVMINFVDFLSYRIDFFEDVALLSKVSFRYDKPQKNLTIYFNNTKLQRIVDNTITNAIKYTLANEVIDIKLVQSGSFVVFIVASKSKTIKDVQRVFDGFYREQNNSDGFGLGLQMVRNICDEEGVEIKVSSDENKTEFSYYFKVIGQ